MKIGYLSDVHLECKNQPDISVPDDLDIMIVAGDVVPGVGAIEWIKDKFVGKVPEIIYVSGNHEGWGFYINELQLYIKKHCDDLGIHYLENDRITIGDYTFIGATCWTDFAYKQPDLETAKRDAFAYMGDYHRVGWVGLDGERRMLEPDDVLSLNNTSKSYIFDCIRECGKDKSIVITHHAPTPLSIGPKFIDHNANAFFVNDWLDLVTTDGPKYWVHGHVHHPVDYVVGNTHVLGNPRGYVNENTGFTGIQTFEV